MAGPYELSLYFVFDDGPGKTVYSYERMAFDPVQHELTWTSGVTKPNTGKYRITAAGASSAGTKIEFDKAVEAGFDAYTLKVTGQALQLTKREVRAGKQDLQRSKYEFTRE